jgi:hypothetical protein
MELSGKLCKNYSDFKMLCVTLFKKKGTPQYKYHFNVRNQPNIGANRLQLSSLIAFSNGSDSVQFP